MICTSEEAKNYKCCMMDKQCEGDSCMAWTIHFQRVTKEQKKPGFFSNGYDIDYFENSGKGYCGMPKK